MLQELERAGYPWERAKALAKKPVHCWGGEGGNCWTPHAPTGVIRNNNDVVVCSGSLTK